MLPQPCIFYCICAHTLDLLTQHFTMYPFPPHTIKTILLALVSAGISRYPGSRGHWEGCDLKGIERNPRDTAWRVSLRKVRRRDPSLLLTHVMGESSPSRLVVFSPRPYHYRLPPCFPSWVYQSASALGLGCPQVHSLP